MLCPRGNGTEPSAPSVRAVHRDRLPKSRACNSEEAPQWANLGNATSGSEKSNINRGELWGECAPLIRCDDNGTSPLAFLPQAHNLSRI